MPEFENRKLGRRPPTNAPALMLRDVLTGKVPAHPVSVDYLDGITFGLYENDRYSDCGPTDVANSRRQVTHLLTGSMQAPSQEDVFDLYRRSGNPNFNPTTGADDNGVVMQDMLKAVHDGGIGGVKCIAYAKVDVNDHETLRAATAIFGQLHWGVDLQVEQQSQTDQGYWDYSPSAEWGGHAILGGAYDSSNHKVVTWGELVRVTDSFVQNQLEEAWVVIWPEHLGTKEFMEGIDLTALQQAYRTLTGRDLPMPVPPSPSPPQPDPEEARFLDYFPPDVRSKVVARAARKKIAPSKWVVDRIAVYVE